MPYIGVSPQFGVRRKRTYTAMAGQTSFSGAGSEGATLSYTDSNFVDVYQNGVKLGDADYTSTSGTAIVLAQGASVNDLVEIIVFDAFSAADTVSKSDGGTFDGSVTFGGGVSGDLTIEDKIVHSGDTDTNIRFPAVNTVSFETAGSERLRINDDGNILVGRTTELNDFGDGRTSLVLQGSGSQDYSTIQLANNGTGSNNQILGLVAFYDGTNENARIQAQRGDGTDVGDLLFYTRKSSGSLTEAMRVYRDGNVGIGSTEPNFKFQVRSDSTSEGITDLRSNSTSFTGTILLVGSNTTTTNNTYNHIRADIHGVAQKFAVRDNGNVANTNNTYGSISDERIKENIVDANSQWNDIKALKIRRYNRIGEEQKEIGVIAQELEASNMSGLVEDGPYYDVINNPDEENRKTVKYSILYMKAVKALQEAMTRIEKLEAEVKALKGE